MLDQCPRCNEFSGHMVDQGKAGKDEVLYLPTTVIWLDSGSYWKRYYCNLCKHQWVKENET